MDQDDINRLREILDVPLRGTIDFKKVLGSTLSDALEGVGWHGELHPKKSHGDESRRSRCLSGSRPSTLQSLPCRLVQRSWSPHRQGSSRSTRKR